MHQPVDGEWYEASDDKWYCWPDPTPCDNPPREDAQDPPPPPAPAASEPATARLSALARGLLVVGIVAIAIGCLLPWFEVDELSPVGTDFDDGKLFLGGSAVLAVLAGLAFTLAWRTPYLILLIVLASLITAGSVADRSDMSDLAKRLNGEVGPGLVVVIAGGLATLAGAIKGLFDSRRQP